jgi:phytoene dehydrogenase-like protein
MAIQIVKSSVRGNPGIPRKGVGQLSNALASRINQIKLNTVVERLEGKLVHTNNGTYLADKIIIATDATRATQLLDLKEVPRMAGCITWYHSTDVNPSGSGRLVIDGENRGPIFNTVVMSDISKAYSPQGKHLISTTTSLNVTESDVRRHLSTLWQSNTHTWQLIAKY